MSEIQALAVVLLPLAMFVAVWPLRELFAGRRRRDAVPLTPGQVSYLPGSAQVSWDETLVDAFAGRSW